MIRKLQSEYPKLYVFHEKHGDNHYLVESLESELKMFLTVLKERNNIGWFNWMKDHKPYSKAPLYSKEDILSMPVSMDREKSRLLSEYLNYEKMEKECQSIRNDWVHIQEAIKNEDGKLAHRILSDLSDGEYEGFESVDFTHIK